MNLIHKYVLVQIAHKAKKLICFVLEKEAKILIYNKINFHIFSVHLHTAGFLSLFFFSFQNSGKHMIDRLVMTHTIFFNKKMLVNFYFFFLYMMAAKLHCFFNFFVQSNFFYERTNKGRGGLKKICKVFSYIFGKAFKNRALNIAKT